MAANFNPRSLTGATAKLLSARRLKAFQSTLPHGSDHCPASAYCAVWNFNPRSLTGATITTSLDGRTWQISIHAPSRERQAYIKEQMITVEFQSTLPHGSDLFLLSFFILPANFNPRSLTGATFVLSHRRFLCCYFNPRSLTGATFG